MKKETIFLIAIVLIIIAIIFTINYARGNGNHTEETMQCIADNSILFVSKTCGHCANQKQILGDSLNLFQIHDINDEVELASQYSVTRVPTWIINEQKYEGVRSVSQLKELTRC